MTDLAAAEAYERLDGVAPPSSDRPVTVPEAV